LLDNGRGGPQLRAALAWCGAKKRLTFLPMRALFVLIVLGGIAYLGWVFRQELSDKVSQIIPHTTSAPEPSAPPPPDDRAPARPPLANTQELAPPGTYYVTERIVTQTEAGVKALNPGEEVKLMYRHKDGTMLVTNGREEFVVKPSALTRDRAQAARAGSK